MKNIALLLLLLLTGWLVAQDKPEIFVQMGHDDYINSVAFSPNGKYLVSGCGDKTLKLWDISTGKEVRTFIGHTEMISSVVFSPDGKFIISGSWDGTLKLWDIALSKAVRTFIGHGVGVTSVDISLDGKFVISGCWDKTLKLWDIDTGKEIRTFTGHTDYVNSVVFSSDCKMILSGSEDKTIKLWDAKTGKELKSFIAGFRVLSIEFSPTGESIIGSGKDGKRIILDVITGNELKSFLESSCKAGVFSPNGKLYISGLGEKDLKLWDTNTGLILKTFSKQTYKTGAITFSPDGKLFVSSSGDRSMILWDIDTGQDLRTFKTAVQNIFSINVSPDNKLMITRHGSIHNFNDHVIKLWDLRTGQYLKTLISCVKAKDEDIAVFSPDGKSIISSSNDGILKSWDVNTGKELKKFSGHKNCVNSVAFAPNGKLLLSASNDSTLKLWDIFSTKEIRTFRGHTDKISSIAFSPDSKSFISSSNDGILKSWNVNTGKELTSFKFDNSDNRGGNVLSYSPNGKYFTNGCKIWETSTNKKIEIDIEISEQDKRSPSTIAFSPYGKYLVLYSHNGGIYLVDISTFKTLKKFTGHSGLVSSVLFSNDNSYIISTSWDGTIRKWNVTTGEEIAQFISFTDDEWLTITPDGYFNASPNGAKNINVRVGNSVYSIDNFFDTYYRPDIVSARLRGENTDAIDKSDLTKGIKTPPEVTVSIKTKNNNFQTLQTTAQSDFLITNGTIKVKVTATSTGGGIKGIRLFNNGKLVGENIRGIKIVQNENTYEQEFEVNLADGSNDLKVIGFSDDMTESNPVNTEISYTAAKVDKPDMYILTIGINEYRNSKYNLNYCVDDVNGFVNTLTPKAKKIFNNVYTTTILNKDATKAGLVKAFADIKSKIKTGDVFTFFYAGHGIALDIEAADGKTISEFFYVLNEVTQMSQPEKCQKDGISGSEMRTLLAEIKANKQIMFVDACNSGAFAAQFANRGAAEENSLAKLSRATGSVIFASTTKEQFATEFKELKHGVFTFVVLEALNGNGALANGQLTAGSIKTYVEDKIPEYSKKYKGEEQWPTTFMWGQDFPLGVK